MSDKLQFVDLIRNKVTFDANDKLKFVGLLEFRVGNYHAADNSDDRAYQCAHSHILKQVWA